MTNRTDGPALNARPGRHRRPARRLQPARLRRPADREPERGCKAVWDANRLGRGHPLRAALPRALRDRARAARPARDGAAAAALRARAWSGSAKRFRSRCAAARPWREVVERAGAAWRARTSSTRRRCAGAGSLSPPARCAALTALLDLRGQAGRRRIDGLPPPRRPASRSRCNATLVAGRAGRGRRRTRERWAEDGFSTFKLKLGAGEDVAQVRAVREALGPEARIRVDANGAWDVDDGEADAGRAGAARRRAGRAAGGDARRRWRELAGVDRRSRSPATRASRAAPTRSGRSRPAPARWPGQALQGRRPGGGDRDRRGPALLSLQRARRPGRDRRRRAGGADPARGDRPDGSTSPTASPPSASSPRPSPRSSAS